MIDRNKQEVLRCDLFALLTKVRAMFLDDEITHNEYYAVECHLLRAYKLIMDFGKDKNNGI